MGRIFSTIQINGKRCRTLFDSGARNSYVLPAVAEGLPRWHLAVPRHTGLGGKVRLAEEICVLAGTLEGKPIEMEAYVLDAIGRDDDGRPIDILLGALAMQKWGIRLIPEEERLDLSHYPEEFTEFSQA
ncbi:MAG: retroviral-like aspartic protease [Planctomycetes bacterium]|nr:retroviral-like aspartic protease [Planctomycetota bacterium]